MKKIILIISLISISSCAPFKGIDSCIDIEGKGSKCSTITDNLISVENREYRVDNSSLIDNISSDEAVNKDELVRLMTSMSIDSNTTKSPTIIQPATYRMLILPYTSNAKLYSSRYIYFVAGKTKWVNGDYIISGEPAVKVDVPKVLAPTTLTVIEIDDRLEINPIDANNKYYVASPAGLNCRRKASAYAEILATYEDGKLLNVIDDSSDRWFKTDMYGVKCYVDNRYLRTENDK